MKPIKDFEWRGVVWEEINPLDLRVMQYGKEIRLTSYRYPPANGERKGVVFFCHGYDSCQPHIATVAKYLAQAGYEVFAVDMRGHGDSEGQRGVFEENEKIYEDYWLLVFEACKKFRINQQRTPIYLFGRSFGGLIATNMANTTIGRSMFAGVVLLTPYYRLFTERLYDAYKFIVPLSMVKPMHKFPTEFAEMDEEYEEQYKEIFHDPREIGFFTAKTARIWVEEQKIARESIQQAPMPICFIVAEKENCVRNDYIEEFSRLVSNDQGEYHMIGEADHTDICFHKNYCS